MSKIKKDLCNWILENELVEKWIDEDIVNIDGYFLFTIFLKLG